MLSIGLIGINVVQCCIGEDDGEDDDAVDEGE